MALVQSQHNAGHTKRDGKDAIEFRLIFFVSFLVFLIAAVVERLLPWRWQAASPQEERRRSVFEQAREAAGTCTTYAFMG